MRRPDLCARRKPMHVRRDGSCWRTLILLECRVHSSNDTMTKVTFQAREVDVPRLLFYTSSPSTFVKISLSCSAPPWNGCIKDGDSFGCLILPECREKNAY